MRTIEVYEAKLVVTPDNSTPGSEGRLYLQLPDAMANYVGKVFMTLGTFGVGYVVFTAHPDGHTVSPKRQFWWKNGVRDHKVTENHIVRIWVLTPFLWLAEVIGPTGERPPILPPRQITLFV
jgi:hypothetical protein